MPLIDIDLKIGHVFTHREPELRITGRRMEYTGLDGKLAPWRRPQRARLVLLPAAAGEGENRRGGQAVADFSSSSTQASTSPSMPSSSSTTLPSASPRTTMTATAPFGTFVAPSRASPSPPSDEARARSKHAVRNTETL